MNKWVEELSECFLCFVAFGMIGWLYEVAVMYFEMHMGFVNRGFLFGPCLPIYGFGGMLIVLLLGTFRKKKLSVGRVNILPLICFVAICILATVMELFASFGLERLLGRTLWDYRGTGFGPTYEGRIALWSSVRFGVIGMSVLYGIYPLMEKGFGHWRKRFPKGYYGTAFLVLVLFGIDLIYHLIYGSNATW